MKNATHNAGDAVITKMRLIREVNNCMCHNFYYEARFRVYNGPHTFYRGNFVVWFDTDDLAEEYPDKARFSKRDIREYAGELAVGFLDQAPRKEITAETMRPFYNECAATINRYNGVYKAA